MCVAQDRLQRTSTNYICVRDSGPVRCVFFLQMKQTKTFRPEMVYPWPICFRFLKCDFKKITVLRARACFICVIENSCNWVDIGDICKQLYKDLEKFRGNCLVNFY